MSKTAAGRILEAELISEPEDKSRGQSKSVKIKENQLDLFVELPVSTSRDATDLDLMPLDATFRDSSEAPLHSWFPYLEGYSPRFVERVRQEYLDGATRIIEPFAGSGTTPIVLGQAGVACAFAEANPVMVFIAETKLAVLALPQPERDALARNLRALARSIADKTQKAKPDEDLRCAYSSSFGKSIFFDAFALEAVLRLRTFNDEILLLDKLLGDCFAVAVLSSLIPSSLLKRAGDLRFKTSKELVAGVPDPIELVSVRLIAQVNDLSVSMPLRAEAKLAAKTAGSLHEKLDREWDGVITSPPYLNGTNYIRNARLELWYLRHLKVNSDLRCLRDSVITSGINDVHTNTRWQPVTSGVDRVVRAIESNAYDSRIPKMVGGYFSDMAAVFSSLGRCVRPGGRICIDIGDSIYNSVHVPTDDLLVEVAESMGFRTIERVHLRKRVSKSGETVRQQLLVFEQPKKLVHPTSPASVAAELSPKATRKNAKRAQLRKWEAAWDDFKKTMPHQLQPFAKREWGGPLHSMCSYQGKLKPALAHHLVKCFSAPGDVVVDPFSGAGTIPLEACRNGRKGYGIDIARLGHVLTLAKVARPDLAVLEKSILELESALKRYRLKFSDVEQAAEVRFNSAIPDYFHPDTLKEVIAARKFFLSRWNSGAEWAVLYACTMHLLHGNRPYALSRRSHPVTPFKPTGEFEYRPLIPRLRDKLERLYPDMMVRDREWGNSTEGDCTVLWPAAIPKANVVITSPPFFDSTRFYMTNWMRYWFAGWERKDFDASTSDFVETKQKQNLDIYKAFFAATRERLEDDGIAVLHLGNSPKCDMGAELAKRVSPWFDVADIFTEGVEHCESHGIRDKGTTHGHTYLVITAR